MLPAPRGGLGQRSPSPIELEAGDPSAEAPAEVDTPLPVVIFLHGYSYQLGYTGIYGLYGSHGGANGGLINALVSQQGVALRAHRAPHRRLALLEHPTPDLVDVPRVAPVRADPSRPDINTDSKAKGQGYQ
mgnify:CR=1 FL=1